MDRATLGDLHMMAAVAIQAVSFGWLFLVPGDDLLMGNKHVVMAGRRVASPLSLAISPDKKFVAVSTDKYVRVWDIKQNTVAATLEHQHVSNVSFSHDSTQLALTGTKEPAHIYSVKTWKPTHEFPGEDTFFARFTKNGKTLITSDVNSHLIYWDLETRKPRKTSKVKYPLCYRIDLSSDETKFVMGNRYGEVFLLDSDGKLIYEVEHQPKFIDSVSFSSDNKLLAIAVVPNRVVIWDIDKKCVQHQLNLKHICNDVHQAVFVPGKSWVGLATIMATLHIFDAATGKHVIGLRAGNHRLYRIAFSSDGTVAAGVDNAGFVYTWNVPDLKKK